MVFGAVALGLHGLARATGDLDLFIDPTAANVERLKLALKSVFDDPGNLRDVVLMMAFYARMNPDPPWPRGVRKFKTIDEANEDRGDPYRSP